MPIDVSKSQAMVAAEAIPILQMMIKSSAPGFHDRAESLLHCLPGCLTVTIKRANNLRHVMGGTNPFCRLTIGNGPARQTKSIRLLIALHPQNGMKDSHGLLTFHQRDKSCRSQAKAKQLLESLRLGV